MVEDLGAVAGGPRPPQRRRHGHTGGSGWRRTATRVTAFVASVLSLALLVGFGWGWHEYRSLNENLHQLKLNALAGGSGDLSKVGSSASNAPTTPGTEQNILITGLDSRDGLSPAEQRLLHTGNDDSTSTDTMMIIHIPADGKHATMISLPRDAYVDIPDGWAKNKINAAYGDVMGDSSFTGTQAQRKVAAADLVVQTVEQLTGLPINHYVQVGFGGFYTITKAIGTIPVNLCKSVDDTVAYNEAHGEGDAGSGFVMSAGHHNMKPIQAFEFVRQRHNLPRGDLDRERRQQYFLAAAFAKMASKGVLLNPIKLDNLIKAIDGALYIDTDLAHHLTTLADQMIDLSAGNITGYTIPTEGNASRVIANSGPPQSVTLVDPAAVRKWATELVNGALPAKTPAGSSGSAAPTGSTGASASPAAPTKQKCIN